MTNRMWLDSAAYLMSSMDHGLPQAMITARDVLRVRLNLTFMMSKEQVKRVMGFKLARTQLSLGDEFAGREIRSGV